MSSCGLHNDTKTWMCLGDVVLQIVLWDSLPLHHHLISFREYVRNVFPAIFTKLVLLIIGGPCQRSSLFRTRGASDSPRASWFSMMFIVFFRGKQNFQNLWCQCAKGGGLHGTYKHMRPN